MEHLLIALLTISTSFAAGNVTPIKQGQVAPYDGYVIDQASSESIRNSVLELEKQKNINNLLNETTDLYKQRFTLYKDQSDNLAKQLVDSRDNSLYSKIGFFILGAGLTGLVAFGAARAVR